MHHERGIILVINDFSDSLDVMSTLLKLDGYSVCTASDGMEGLNVARDVRPTLIISDVAMPGLDGIELSRRIAADAQLRATPVLLVSAMRKDSQSVAEGLRAGARDYLEVPYEADLFRAKVELLVNQRKSEEKLSHLAAIVESFDDAIISYSLSGIVTSWNRGAENIFGYTETEAIGRSVTLMFPPNHQDQIHFLEIIERGESIRNYETVRMHKDEHLVYVSIAYSSINDSTGNITGISTIVRDISERKRIEARRDAQYATTGILAESHSLAEAAPKFLKALCEILGWDLGALWKVDADAEVLRLMKIWHLPSLEVEEFVAASRRHAFEEGIGLPGRVWLKGEPSWIVDVTGDDEFVRSEVARRGGLRSAFAFPIKVGSSVIGVAEFFSRAVREPDMDLFRMVAAIGNQIGLFINRMSTLESLRESEDRYRDLVENSLDLICTHNLEGQILSVNRGAIGMLGYTFDELVKKNLRDILLPKFRENFGKYLETIRSEGVSTGMMVVQTATGAERIVEFRNTLRSEGLSSPIVRSVAHDITERLTAVRALKHSEAQWRALFDNTLDTVLIANDSGIYVDANPAASNLFGVPIAEIVGHTINDFIDVAHHKEAARMWETFIAVGELKGVVPILRPDGKRLEVDFAAKSNYTPGRHLSVLRDLTDQKKLEEQFRQAQKMEAVGHLAGGVAHDFNNLLTAIIGYCDLSLRRLKPNDIVRRNIEEVKKAGERAAGLTRQLLAFSRKQILQPKVLDINEVVADTLKMLSRLIGENVQLSSTFDPALGLVKADPGQIEQVLINLVVNARDAMPHGGEITIETSNATFDSERNQNHATAQPGSHIRLTVSDTGCGMDGETQAHIFEPFFTTKATGKGTGLGLSTVYGIIQQSGGHITVESAKGHGTTFSVYLPRVNAVLEVNESLAIEASHSTETLLIVEDEALVRDMTRLILEQVGFTVLVVPDGDEALKLIEENQQPIHLMLTDVVMPGMSGRQLADKVKMLRPSIRILFMSGYTDDAIVHHGVLEEGTPFLEKPFTPVGLIRKVREVLDK